MSTGTRLVLELLGPPRLMGARRTCELRAGSLSVGRSPEADWSIPDIDRLISRSHLRIDASYGDFILTDTSSNGVYINGGDEPVGYGASVALRDGDRIRIGDAQIAVLVEAMPGSGRTADPEPVATAVPSERYDPLGGPFGAGETSLAVPVRPVIGFPAEPVRGAIAADWMNAVPEAPLPRVSSSASAPEPGRGASVVLPLRPLGQDNPPPAPSLLALVEARPEIPAHRLAAAMDAAGDMLDPRTRQILHQKIKSIIDNDLL